MILVAGFVSWDPNLILSAAFTPENLGMDFFWRRFRTCWMQTYFCFKKMINGKMAPSKSHHQVFARTPTQNPKAPDLRPSAQHTLTVLGHGRPCSKKHFKWGHPENCSKASDLHLSLFVSLKTMWFYSTVSYAILFYYFTLFLPFQQTIANLVVTTSTCPNCKASTNLSPNLNSPLFPVAKAGQFCAFRWYFKPWQQCCFGTEIQYIHSPSMTTFATTLSSKSEKLNPKIVPLLVVDL